MKLQGAPARYQRAIDDYCEIANGAGAAPTKDRSFTRAMIALGDLRLRGIDPDAVPGHEQFLARLSKKEVLALLEGIGVAQLDRELGNFVRLSEESGGNVALLDDNQGQLAAIEEGHRLIQERHDIECLVEGLRLTMDARPDLRRAARTAVEKITDRLRKLDRRWKANIGYFVPFNDVRRAMAQQYCEETRFWWWHLRSRCDLAAVYRAVDGGNVAPHIRECEECGTLLRELGQVVSTVRKLRGQPRPHPDPETLQRFFYGETSGEEEAWLGWHVRTCGSCRWEMEALQRLEETDEAETGDGTEPDVPALVRVVLPAEAQREFVADVESGVGALPGRMIYRDKRIEAWLNRERGRVIVRIYGEGSSDPGAMLYASIAETGKPLRVTARAQEAGRREFDLGGTGELLGKRVAIEFGAGKSRAKLGIVDFASE